MLTLRLRGIYAAVMAWFVGIALMGLANNLTRLTRGSMGLHPTTLLSTTDNLPYFYIIFGHAAADLHRPQHRDEVAFRPGFQGHRAEHADAARASGINPTRYRVFNFTLSCVFAGLLGGFYAHYYGSLTPNTMMHTAKTVEVLAMAYIGGRGTLWGGIAVRLPIRVLDRVPALQPGDLPGLHLVIYGVLMIVVMIYYPAGLAGGYYWLVSKLRKGGQTPTSIEGEPNVA